ncbi:MAG: fluoride efflux transporter CrcB [Rhodospirillales bacterium]|nr:fluoride efflux transporter CrcB [Rhodospirillales bacterium]MCB9996857.1 fluoride efflux transporter CrcB [Rhodospirillales bacterium]
MQTILAIAAGGACGAVLRHFLNSGTAHMFGPDFPWGIMIANILGSFVMGALISWFALVEEVPQTLKAFLTVGLLGAFTTFSTFSLDAVLLAQRGELLAAGLYVAGSVALAIGGLVAGMALIRMVVA